MALTPGTRFGTYEVVEQIGSGGMGEVWRATDTSLKRDVALKVLPQAFVEDADRLARFRREAEMLASLNHPNIATIHGLEQVDGQTVIVMELVEGPTLAERITKGPIPTDEAMGVALQIVAALEAAHEKGIVHRDLKPANVKVRDDGTVKVLDFGISKPIDPTAISGGSAVATTPAVTQTGVILGTAAYMSPEQARGKFVDQRTDIWAFGCLLFEMLTGQPAFGGEDVMLTLARILANETNLESIPATISPAVRHTIKLCLEKDPRKRIHHIGDVRLALAGTFETELPRDAIASAASSSSARIGVATIGLVAGLIIAGAVGAVLWPDSEPRLVTRFEVPIPADQPLRSPATLSLSLSPDGRYIAYATNESGTSEIHIRPYPDVASARIVVSTEGGLDPLWDARGGYLYYAEGTGRARLVRVPVETDPELVLGEPERLGAEIAVAAVRPNYDHDPDEDRWLIRSVDASSESATEGTSIFVVENWTEELKRLVPTE